MRGLEGREGPADGVICGYGLVCGRHVAVCAYDFTVMAGSMGATGEVKVARLRELALTKRRAYEPDLIVAWPTAEISVMGAEGAVEIVVRKQVQEAGDPAAKKAELIAAYRELIDVYVAARNDMIDDVIDPRETRVKIAHALEMLRTKSVPVPPKKHGNIPL